MNARVGQILALAALAALASLAALAALAAAGCSSGPAPEVAASGPATALVALPVTDHLAAAGKEPMLVETSDGALWVSGYGSGDPALWRSTDGGSSWAAVDVGTAEDGAVGNSDVDLAVGPDGTIYFAQMTFDRETSEGTAISIGASRDGGTSWTWSSLSEDRFDDRPWVEVAPDGVAHAIWNDGSGVSYATSSDRGLTWEERPRIHPVGGSSHLAIGPEGSLAVRITPMSASGHRHDPGIDHVAVSTDGGATWTLRELPGERIWTPTFDPADGLLRWVEPLAWDAAGALYALWSEGTTLWLARSSDHGASWTHWPVVDGDETLYFPYLVARAAGELAATWFSLADESLRVNLALVQIATGAEDEPHVTRAEAFSIPAFRQSGEGEEPAPDTAGEYVPVAFLADGRLAVVTTIQDPTADRWGFTFRPYRIE